MLIVSNKKNLTILQKNLKNCLILDKSTFGTRDSKSLVVYYFFMVLLYNSLFYNAKTHFFSLSTKNKINYLQTTINVVL